MRLLSIKKIVLLTTFVLILAPLLASAKEVKWTVNGTLKATHQMNELSTKFGTTSALEGVLVKISARTKVGLVWGLYNKWGEVRTDANGKFTISKDKNQSKRQFKVEVKFDDSKIELRHKAATSSLTKVKWYTVIKDKEKNAGAIDFGNLVFAQGGKHDLGDMEPRGHADIWKLAHLIIERLEAMGSNFEYTTKQKIKYSHDSVLVNPDIPYANPTTKVIYIPDGWLTASTVAHEMAHVQIYNHMKGEICLTETLILTQNTHGLVDDSCVAFHEGIAEYIKDKMMEELFGHQPELPFNRRHISSSLNLNDLDMVQRHDMGWLSFFHTLTTENLYKYDYLTASASSSSSDIVKKSITPLGCTSPNIGFQNVLKIFNENTAKGYPNKLTRDETTILAFLDRAKGILTNKMTDEYREMFEDLTRPQKTGQPSDWLCQIKQEIKNLDINPDHKLSR